MRISQLKPWQKEHLAWRLEHHTHCGYGTSCSIARGEAGDEEVYDIFVKCEKSPRSAKILTKKVESFKPVNSLPKITKVIEEQFNGWSEEDQFQFMKNLLGEMALISAKNSFKKVV